jgi:hypothetical protein
MRRVTAVSAVTPSRRNWAKREAVLPKPLSEEERLITARRPMNSAVPKRRHLPNWRAHLVLYHEGRSHLVAALRDIGAV